MWGWVGDGRDWEARGAAASVGLGVALAGSVVFMHSGSLRCLLGKMTQPVREWRFSKAQISAQVLDSVSAFIIDWPVEKATVEKYGTEMS